MFLSLTKAIPPKGKSVSSVAQSVQSLSHVQLFVTPWAAVHQASLSITNSQSPPKPMPIVSVMPSNLLILCCALLLLPSIFPSIKVLKGQVSLLNLTFCCFWYYLAAARSTTKWIRQASYASGPTSLEDTPNPQKGQKLDSISILNMELLLCPWSR